MDMFRAQSVYALIMASVLLGQNCASTTDIEVDSREIARLLTSQYLAKTPVSLTNHPFSVHQAQQIRDYFTAQLTPQLGDIIGYKVALTNPSAQQKFGVKTPIVGYLLAGMLYNDGANISQHFGARTLAEGDLIVRVADPKINQAKDFQEILACIDLIYPFIELPDLIITAGEPISGSEIIAINTGARAGVLGKPVLLRDFSNPIEQLSNIEVQLFDQQNRLLAGGSARLLLGHPLNVITWLMQELAKTRRSLQQGDLISLGSMTPPIPLHEITAIKAVYTGFPLNQPVTVTVNFYDPHTKKN